MRSIEENSADPAVAFARADSFFAQKRWLVMGSILLAISLFWLALAEIDNERRRNLKFSIGLGAYILGVAWFLGVEIVFFLLRRGG